MTITKTEEFKQTGIGDIPADWEITPIKYLVVDTETVNPAKEPDKEIIYIDVSAVSNEFFRVIAPASYKGANAPGRARKLVKKGDVIVATIRPTLKRIAFIPKELDGQIASTAFCVLRANPKVASGRYLYQRVLCSDFTEALCKIQSGASYPAVTDKDVLAQLISIPKDIKDQEKIAFVLSKIQKAVETQKKIIANLKELKAATMAKLFREGTRGEPLKQTEIGEIPQSWEIIPFRDTCHNFVSGGTPSTKKTEYWNGTIAWTTSAHITGMFLQTGQRNITKAGLENSASNFVTSGNILVGTRVGVGKVAINLIDVAISQDITGCIVKKERFISEYLAFALLTNRCQQFFSANKRGATIKGIPREDVINLFLPIPKTKQEQQEIVDTLLILDRKSGLATNKLKYLQSLFTSTLHQLMTGKKRVKDLNIEAIDNAR